MLRSIAEIESELKKVEYQLDNLKGMEHPSYQPDIGFLFARHGELMVELGKALRAL